MVVGIGLQPLAVWGQEVDTIGVDTVIEQEVPKKKSRWDRLMTWNVMALPYVSYSPETSFNFGASGVGYFKMPNTKQYSDVTFQGGYTLEKQWQVNVDSRLNFDGERRWFMDFRLNVQHYPDWYYGIGSSQDDLLEEPLRIDNNYVLAYVRPQFYLTKHWIVGANVQYLYSDIVNPLGSGMGDGVYGFGKVHMLGLGGIVSYDSRSNTYYPLRGLLFKTMASYYEPYLGSSYRMGYVDVDLRGYVPLYKELLLALQLKTQWAIGEKVPHQMLPTIGGQDIVRGVRGGKWRNDALIALQAELRIPIWRFLKAAAFVSVGDVYGLDDWKWNVPKIGYGVGLRACIHEINMNIRFDVARQNYGDNWSFYFTVKEAF